MTLRALADSAAARLRARSAAPDPVAPDRAAPDPAVPDRAAPDPVAPDPVAPDPGAPDPVAPDPVAPDPGAPDPDARAERPVPPAGPGWAARQHAWPALAGLGLGLLALGPGLARGFLLSYDMVFVPRMPFSAALIGLTGGPPRAVPSDAVVAVASLLMPADILQKLILLLIFVLACSGAAALLARGWTAAASRAADSARAGSAEAAARGGAVARGGAAARGEAAGDSAPLLARLAAGVCYAWNPYVAERLLIGQWALLLGYAALPWVVRLLCTGRGRTRPTRLLGVLVPAAVGGFAAMAVTVVAAVPAALRPGRPGRRDGGRARRLAIMVGCAALLSLPWLIPALVVPVHTDPRGVDAFAARADTPFGRLGSLLMLSGIWNAQTVPRGYGGGDSVIWLLVVLAALGGYLLIARARGMSPGLGIAALAGLAIAAIGVTSPTRAVLRDLVAHWAGFAVLRDGQQFLAPLALAEAVGLGALVAWIVTGVHWAVGQDAHRAARRAVGQDARGAARPAAAGRATTGRGTAGRATGRAAAALGVMAVLAPVVLLPGMAWGLAGRLRPVEYPADWSRARQVIDGDPARGTVLLLPWAAYRRYPWNGGEAVYDPWPRLLGREVISNDGLQVGNLDLAQESADSIRLNRIVTARGPLTRALRAAGVLYVVIDAGPLLGPDRPGLAARARLPGARLIMASPDLVVFRLPGTSAEHQ